MKKREIIIVILLIAFGVLYNIYEEGEIDLFFIDECSINPKGLRDRSHPVLFPQDELQYSDIRRIDIDNPAGVVIVEKSQDNTTTVKPVIRVYHRDAGEAEEISRKVKIAAKEANNRLDIDVEVRRKFPYNRVRIHFKVAIPGDVELNVHNRHGDTEVRGTGKNISLNQRHGDVLAEDIDASLKIYHRHGDVSANNVGGDVDIDSQHGKVIINDVSALKLNCAHSRVWVKGVENETKIDYAAHCTLEVENASKLGIEARHTRIRVKSIKNGARIKDSHSAISMQDISGDINIMARNCKVKLDNIVSDNLIVKNSHGRVDIEDISGKDLDIAVSHGNIDVSFIQVDGRINIKNRHSDILLAYPETVAPSFNIDLKYGKIVNRTAREYTVQKDQQRVSLNSQEGAPEIIINNTYGDVILRNFTPRKPEIKAEAEEFTQ